MSELEWVVLTTGERPNELRRAVASLGDAPVTVVLNAAAGSEQSDLNGVVPPDRVLRPGQNLGVPAGRHAGLEQTSAALVGFLDDDAELVGEVDRITAAFERNPRLAVVSLRIVDEDGQTVARHVPRVGGRSADESGLVTHFLGGACVIRREAYLEVGGYFGELFYGHEELELAWRLADRGWAIEYLAEVRVFHPRLEIGRHPDGWRRTGLNRVLIARRTLPLPLSLLHPLVWLFAGMIRAPRGDHRRSYVRGWRAGWRTPLERRPISWRGVWRLTRLGRPPIV